MNYMDLCKALDNLSKIKNSDERLILTAGLYEDDADFRKLIDNSQRIISDYEKAKEIVKLTQRKGNIDGNKRN